MVRQNDSNGSGGDNDNFDNDAGSPAGPAPQHVAFDDTTPTLATAIIGHAANRELLAIVSNFVMETRINGNRLESIYSEIRALTQPVPMGIPVKLLAEQQRNHTASADNIARLEAWAASCTDSKAP